jgi:hypothetical protein
MKKLSLALSAIGFISLGSSLSAFASTPLCAILYEHDNFRGKNLAIAPGQYEHVHGFWEDRVSSISVADGCQITVYRHSYYRGDAVTLTSSMGDERVRADLGRAGFNDKMSSLVCSCYY